MSFLSFQIKAGWMLNIFGIVVITFYINTYGKALLNLDTSILGGAARRSKHHKPQSHPNNYCALEKAFLRNYYFTYSWYQRAGYRQDKLMRHSSWFSKSTYDSIKQWCLNFFSHASLIVFCFKSPWLQICKFDRARSRSKTACCGEREGSRPL